MTTYGYVPKSPEFMRVELKDPHSVGQAMQNINNQGYANWVSPMLRLPANQSENRFNALALFVVPKSFYDKKLQLFLTVKDESEGFTPFPNAVAAATGNIEADLKKMHFASPPSPLLFPMNINSSSPAYSFMGQTKCRLELIATPAGGEQASADAGRSFMEEGGSILGGMGGGPP